MRMRVFTSRELRTEEGTSVNGHYYNDVVAIITNIVVVDDCHYRSKST